MIGVKVFQSPYLTEEKEDWSRVRSPSRARRRMKKGYRQNVTIIRVPMKGALSIGGALYMHPETWRQMREEMQRK